MFSLILAAGLAVGQPVAAQKPVEPTTEAPAKAKGAPSADDFVKMMKMFDKMFPPQPDPDPARLAKARGVAQAMWPDGTYGLLIEHFATTIGNSVLDMKPSDFAALDAPKKPDPKAKPKPPEPDIPLREKLRAEDPNFDKRVEVLTAALRDEFKRISPLIEPPLREGMSRALARRFTEPQLADLSTFYNSPTGQVYARESMKMWLDSDIARATMNSMPALIMQLPGAMERIKAANDSVPPPPKKKK